MSQFNTQNDLALYHLTRLRVHSHARGSVRLYLSTVLLLAKPKILTFTMLAWWWLPFKDHLSFYNTGLHNNMQLQPTQQKNTWQNKTEQKQNHIPVVLVNSSNTNNSELNVKSQIPWTASFLSKISILTQRAAEADGKSLVFGIYL